MIKKIYYVQISLRSGNSISLWLDDFKTKADGVEWVNSYPGSKDYLMYLESKGVIEAVVVQKTGYRFLRWSEIKEKLK